MKFRFDNITVNGRRNQNRVIYLSNICTKEQARAAAQTFPYYFVLNKRTKITKLDDKFDFFEILRIYGEFEGEKFTISGNNMVKAMTHVWKSAVAEVYFLLQNENKLSPETSSLLEEVRNRIKI